MAANGPAAKKRIIRGVRDAEGCVFSTFASNLGYYLYYTYYTYYTRMINFYPLLTSIGRVLCTVGKADAACREHLGETKWVGKGMHPL